jgi:hypothetical protein
MANPFQGFLTSIKSLWTFAKGVFGGEIQTTEERVEADALEVETYAAKEVPAFLRVGQKVPDFQRNIPVTTVGTASNVPTASPAPTPLPTPQPTLAPVAPGPVVQPDPVVQPPNP